MSSRGDTIVSRCQIVSRVRKNLGVGIRFHSKKFETSWRFVSSSSGHPPHNVRRSSSIHTGSPRHAPPQLPTAPLWSLLINWLLDWPMDPCLDIYPESISGMMMIAGMGHLSPVRVALEMYWRIRICLGILYHIRKVSIFLLIRWNETNIFRWETL